MNEAMPDQPMSPWRDISCAPVTGMRFIGRRGRVERITWHGKTSHIPLYGWCHGRDAENIDLWEPTHWKHKPIKT